MNRKSSIRWAIAHSIAATFMALLAILTFINSDFMLGSIQLLCALVHGLNAHGSYRNATEL